MLSLKRTYKQTISAIILLMVMIMQMGVKTFHQHNHAESSSIVCSDCEHHKVHSGHLTNWEGNSDECTLCQLLTTPFSEGSILTLGNTFIVYNTLYFCPDSNLSIGNRSTIRLRGPPAFLL